MKKIYNKKTCGRIIMGLFAMLMSNSIFADNLKFGDKFWYVSGENSICCLVTKECSGGKGTVDIVKQNDFDTYAETQNYFDAAHEPKGKLVIPAVVTDESGNEYDVKHVYGSAFYNCLKLTELEVNAEEIWSWAFSFCENLEKVTIGDNVSSISDSFWHTKIKAINLNHVTETLGNNPFGYCECLEEISKAEDNVAFAVVDGVLYTGDKKTLLCFPSKKDFASWTGFPNETEKIAEEAFGYVQMDKLVIPASVADSYYSHISAFECCSPKVVYANGRYMCASTFTSVETIEELHIAETVQLIGQLYINCGEKIKDVYLYGTELPNWEYGSTYTYASLKGCYNATLHVKPGCDMPAKIAADTDKWANFKNVVEDITSVPGELTSIVHVNTSADNTAAYSLTGMKVDDNYHGIVIINGKKVLK